MNHTAPESVQKCPARRSILDMDCGEAAAFLLKGENYCRIELPRYFGFDRLLGDVAQALEAQKTPLCYRRARQFEHVNHPILSSKDGKYAWRPLQLVHPVLYSALV